MYKQDSITFSLFFGRSGAIISTLLAAVFAWFGFKCGEENLQIQIFEEVASVLATIAFLQVSISKIRESRKIKKN